MVGERRVDQGALGRAVLDDEQGELVGHGRAHVGPGADARDLRPEA
jgi:hypothetical protein